MKLKHTKKNAGFTLVELLVVIAIIAGLAAISSPIIIRQISRARATQALNNGKDIYVGIRDYAFQRGGATMAAEATSYQTFQRLFNAGILQDEKPFFVTGVTGKELGDENNSLDADENVYSYFAASASGGAGANITNGATNNPIIGAPIGDTDGTMIASTWDTAPFGGQAVIVFADGAAITFPLLAASAASSTTGSIINPENSASLDSSDTYGASSLVSIPRGN